MTKRLIISYLAITVVVLILLELPLAIFYAQREQERLTSAVERDAAVVATIYEDDLEDGRTPDPNPADLYEARTGARVVVVDARGISVVDTEQPVPRDFSTRPEIATALTGSRSVGTRRSETLGTELLYVALPIASGGEVHGAIRITLDTARVDAQVHRFWWGLAGIALVALAAMGLVGWLIARSVALPLRRLSDTARRFGHGDFTVETRSVEGPPELRELSKTMSTMAGQLSALIDEQRAFVADASHQLRTPLTGLRLRLENLQAGLADVDAEKVESAIEEVTRLSALVTDLLRLASADRPESPTPNDLVALVSDRLDTWSAVADSAQVRLLLTADCDSAIVSAVPGAIEQILDNLLDNAIGVSPPGSTVTVAVTAGERTHQLCVADQGPGLSDADKQRATRRFWRGDTTRHGTGLGLAIVSSLARASDGTLHLADAPRASGLSVTVELPAVQPAHAAS